MAKYLQTKEEIGKRMRVIRKHVGRSQESLSKDLKIDRATYSHYEMGIYEPKLTKLIQLAEILDVNFLYFIIKEKPIENEIF